MQKAWFKDWFNSPYYHQLYINRDENEAAAFIDQLITHLHPQEGSRMLDVACGKGRHAVQLAGKGFDVSGIDLSEESITEALQFETDTLHFYRHDMRLPCWINYFDYAFNFFTSFGYFKSRREHDNAIRTIAQSIRHQGYFVMDYMNIHFTEGQITPTATKQIEGIVFNITKWFDDTHFYKKIIVQDAELDAPIEFTERVAKFSLADFNRMFAQQGLLIQEVYGDYSFSPYNAAHSPRLIMIAKKM